MNIRTTLGALAAGVLLTGLALGGSAVANDDAAPANGSTAADSPDRTSHYRTSQDRTAQDRTSVQHERGIVIEAASEDPALPAFVSLYENDLHGNSLQVVVGDPEDDLIGAIDGAEPFVVDGAIDVSLQIDGKTARLVGTVVETGTSRQVDPLQDGGEQLVMRGTHTDLAVDLTLSYDDAVVPLQVAPAFAYDLETRRVTLYGN